MHPVDPLVYCDFACGTWSSVLVSLMNTDFAIGAILLLEAFLLSRALRRRVDLQVSVWFARLAFTLAGLAFLLTLRLWRLLEGPSGGTLPFVWSVSGAWGRFVVSYGNLTGALIWAALLIPLIPLAASAIGTRRDSSHAR